MGAIVYFYHLGSHDCLYLGHVTSLGRQSIVFKSSPFDIIRRGARLKAGESFPEGPKADDQCECPIIISLVQRLFETLGPFINPNGRSAED